MKKFLLSLLLLPGVFLNSVQAQYCSTGDYYSNVYMGISSVKFNTINNVTNYNNIYTYYASPTTTVNTGSNYTLELTNYIYYPGYPYYGQYASVWIDYNQNQVYESSEMVINNGYFGNYGAWNINIPTTAPSGTTRMRIRTDYYSISDPCYYLYWGETEEYSITVNNGSALNFDGATDYVSIPNPFYQFNNELTVEWWVNPSSFEPLGSGIGQGTVNVDDMSNNVWLMHFDGTGTRMVFYVNDGGTWRGTSPYFLPTGWHHVLGVANSSSVRLFVDGVLVATGPGISGTIWNNSGSQIHFGKDVRYNSNRFMNGSIDEVRIWNKALCGDEITHYRNCEVPGVLPGLVGNYHFNQGIASGSNPTETTLNDASGNNRHGTLNNFALSGGTSNWITPGGVTNGNSCPTYQTPEIVVTGNNVTIFDGDLTPSGLDNTDWGTNYQSSQTKTYVIKNGGNAPLVISNIFSSNSFFSTSGISYPLTIPANSTYNLNVNFNSASTGVFSSRITINNNDCDEPSYDFQITNNFLCLPASFTASPSNISTNTGATTCNAAVNYSATIIGIPFPSVSFNMTGASSGSGGGTGSGFTFNKGITNVTISANNGCLAPASSNFTVEVKDVTPPVAKAKNISIGLNTAGMANITAAMVNDGSTDNCGIASMTVSPNSFDCSNTGANNVTLTVTDVNGNSSTASAVVTVTALDTDGDGMADVCDLDDDNDGITDKTECNKSNFFWSSPPTISGYTASGTINGISYTYTSSQPVSTTSSMYGHGNFPSSYGVPNANPTIQNIYVTNNTLTFASPMTNPMLVFASIGQGGVRVPITFGAPVQVLFSQNVTVNSSTQITGEEGYAIVRMNGVFSSISFNYLAQENWCNFAFGADFQSCGDADNDGTPDYLDTDSDNDGCPDAIEGSMHFTMAQTSGGMLTGGINTDGIPLLAGAGQGVGTSNTYIANCFCQPLVDQTPPVVITKDITVVLNGAGTVTVPASAIDNGSSDACGIQSYTLSQSIFKCPNLGTNSVLLIVKDINGNQSSAPATITVLDNLSPFFTSCPSNINVVATSGAGATVNYPLPGAKDNCAYSLTLTEGLTSGSTFPIGTTKVTYLAVDISGNSASCSFDVTVTGVAPVVICPAPILINTTPGICATNVNFTATETTGIPASTLNYSIAPGSTFNVGTVMVTATATNIVGTSSCSFNVTVQDKESPAVHTKNKTLYLDASGNATLTTADINDNSTDNCGIAGMSLNKTNFSCNNVTTARPGVVSTRMTADNLFTAYLSTNDNIAGTQFGSGNRWEDTYSLSANLVPGQNYYLHILVQDIGLIEMMIGDFTLTGDFVFANGQQFMSSTAGNWKASSTGWSGYGTPYEIGSNGIGPWGFRPGISAGAKFMWTNLGDFNTPGGNFGYFTTPIIYTGGPSNVVLTVTDVNGNTASENAEVTIVDNLAPVITCTDNIAVYATSAAGATVNYPAATATDNCSATVSRIGGLPSGATFPIGTTTVTYQAKDPSGNTATCSFDVVVSGIPPVINCPATVKVTTDPGRCGANVGYLATETTAIPASTITYSIAPGSFFNVGTVQVTATATNPVGTSSCSFDVVVEDKENPNVLTQNLSVNLNAAGNVSITAAQIDNGSNDACGIASITVSPDQFNCGNVGPNNVTLTVTDIHGNTKTGPAVVTVSDVTDPVVITQNLTIYLDANGMASVTPQDVNNGSHDACGIAEMFLSDQNFTCGDVGVNQVTLVVKDVNGNIASAPANVTVVDRIAPIALCKNATVTLSGGTASITAAMVDNGSNDACGIKSLSVSKSTFDCSNIGANTVVLTVTDNNDNTNTCTATVNVVGVIPSCNITSAASGTVIGSTLTNAVVNQMFLGYGYQNMTLTCSALPAGTGPFTYNWSGSYLSGTGNVRTFAPTAGGNYSITCTVTNGYGCVTTCSIVICVIDARGSGGSPSNPKVQVCHVPPGNPGNPQSIEIGVSAVAAHIAGGNGHGTCRLGFCPEVCGSQKTSDNPSAELFGDGEVELLVYPNPSSSSFTFQLESASKEEVSITVFDMSGKLISENVFASGHESMMVIGSNLANGIYLAHVKQGDFIKIVKIQKLL